MQPKVKQPSEEYNGWYRLWYWCALFYIALLIGGLFDTAINRFSGVSINHEKIFVFIFVFTPINLFLFLISFGTIYFLSSNKILRNYTEWFNKLNQKILDVIYFIFSFILIITSLIITSKIYEKIYVING